MTISNVLRLILGFCIAGTLYSQYMQMAKFRPTLEDFVPKTVVTGVFASSDYGKALQGSRINGHSIYIAANYAGGTRGFARYRIPNGSTVSATIAEIKTRSGPVWVPGKIWSGSQEYVSRSPEEMYKAWFSETYQSLIWNCFFISSAFAVGYFIILSLIPNGRS